MKNSSGRGTGNVGAGYGSATLLMLFSVLCLTVFAVLAYCSSGAELRLTNRFVSYVTNYYDADTRATRIYARLTSSSSLEDTLISLRNGGLDVKVEAGGNGTSIYSYTCDVDDKLVLDVQLERDGRNWRVVFWNLRETDGWDNDNTLNVFIPDEDFFGSN